MIEKTKAKNNRVDVQRKQKGDNLPDVSMDKLTVMRLAGEDLSQQQLDVFQDYYTRDLATPLKAVADKHGISLKQIRAWQRTQWWQLLFDEFIKNHSNDLYSQMAQKVPDMIQAMDAILKADHEYDKSASAIVNLIRLFADMGENPLIRKSKDGLINQRNTINLFQQHNEITIDDLKGCSAEEILEIFDRGTLQLPTDKTVN